MNKSTSRKNANAKSNKTFRKLLDNYIVIQKKAHVISEELFPRIREIMKLWGYADYSSPITEMWIDNPENIDPWIGEICLNVTVNGWDDCDVISFPIRYLDMYLNDIKMDVKKFKEKVETQKMEDQLRAERREYERLKAKFEKIDKAGHVK